MRLCAALFLAYYARALGTFCGSRTSSISNPPLFRMWWHPVFPVYWCACVCLCAFVCIFVCWKKEKNNGVDADSAGREVLHEHAVVVAMLIIFTEFFVFVYLLLFFIPLSLILSSAFHMYLFTFYGSFCSIPRQLLLRRGFVTINLLVFLFTE